MNIHGIPVISNPYIPEKIPVIELSHTFKWCSKKFRKEQNQFLKEMFGTKTNILIIQNPLTGEDNYIMHPNILEFLRHIGANHGT